MAQKLQIITNDDFIEEFPDIGTYNQAPAGWRKANEKKIIENYQSRIYYPSHFAYRQLFQYHKKDGGENFKDGYVECALYIFSDKTGYAVKLNYATNKFDYYLFGCDHKYKELSQEGCRKRNITHYGKCYHVNECMECGHIQQYDSSD